MQKVERVRKSSRNWIVPVSDGFLIGTRAVVMRLIRGGPTLRQLISELDARLRNGAIAIDSLCNDFKERFPYAIVDDTIRKLTALGIFEIETEEHFLTGANTKNHCYYDYFVASRDQAGEKIERLKAGRVVVIGYGDVAKEVVRKLVEAELRQVEQLVIPWSSMDPEQRGTDKGANSASGGATQSKHKLVSVDEHTSGATMDECAASDLIISCADDPLERLRLFPLVNEISLNQSKPWLSGYADGDQVFLGPLFIPRETGCFRCLELREESCLDNIQEYRTFKAFLRTNDLVCASASSPSSRAMLGCVIAAEAIRTLARLSFPATYQTMIEFDLASFEVKHHVLLKVPFCDACGPHVNQPFRMSWGL